MGPALRQAGRRVAVQARCVERGQQEGLQLMGRPKAQPALAARPARHLPAASARQEKPQRAGQPEVPETCAELGRRLAGLMALV